MTLTVPAIDPLVVASTIAAAKRLESPGLADLFEEDPKLIDLLWFIQWRSAQPGGLCGFVREMLESDPEAFNAAGIQGHVHALLSLDAFDDFLRRFHEVPKTLQERLVDGAVAQSLILHSLGPGSLDDEDDREVQSRRTAELLSDAREQLQRLDAAGLAQSCRGMAEHAMPGFLVRLCAEPNPALFSQGFWYCKSPVAAVRRAMDRHARSELGALANTSICAKVIDALEYASSCCESVWIYGNPRLGKSTGIGAFCRAYPGRARLILVPYSESDADLFRAVAKALGIQFNLHTPAWQLRESIGRVLDNSNMLTVFDEAHFLFPVNVSPRSNPSRLNWVRTEVMDRKRPCALCASPQGYNHAQRRFESATKYPMEQWLGRAVYRVKLDDTPSSEDALAVVAKFLPGLPEDLSNDIASRALQHDAGLKAIEGVASRATFLARKAGRPGPGLLEIAEAMESMLPPAFAAVEERRKPVLNPPAGTVHRDCRPMEAENDLRPESALGRGRHIRPAVEVTA